MYFTHVIYISHAVEKFLASNIHIFCCLDIVGVIITFLHSLYKSSSFLEDWCIFYRCGPRTLLDPETQQACHAEFDLKQSCLRVGDECVYER
jgi:hypothetical protein